MTDRELETGLLDSLSSSQGPSPPRTLEREDASVGSERATAGSNTNVEEPVLANEGQLAAHKARREEMLREMRGDVERIYVEQRAGIWA